MDIYEFSWVPLNRKATDENVNNMMFVQTADRKMMDLFLLQHGFDPQTPNVRVTHDETYSDDDEITLHLYTFGSKRRDRLYQIATTEEIMTTVITTISQTLSDAMSFGACALRGDEIELFARIQSLIEILDFVYIRETNPIFQENSVDDYYRYTMRSRSYEMSRDDDTDVLSDELFDSSKPNQNEPVPFTIEAYLNIFAKDYLLGKEVKYYGKKGKTVDGDCGDA